MKITKEDNHLVLRVPMVQNSYDATGELIGKVPNIIGVIDEKGQHHSISHLADLAYKGTQQVGSPIIDFSYDREGLEDVCKELQLNIWHI